MTDSQIRLDRRVPVKHTVDVAVVGGGPAGVAAAVSAARKGARVFLAEQTACLGGMGTAGLVPGFMTFSDGRNLLVRGFGLELVERLRAKGGTGPDDRADKWNNIGIQFEALKLVYDEMVTAEDILLRFTNMFVDVVMDGSRIGSLVLCGKAGLYAVKASLVVDATGDALVSCLSGVPTEAGGENGETMGATLAQLLGPVDWERNKEWKKNSPGAFQKALEKAFADGHFSEPDRHHPGTWRGHKHLAGLNAGHIYGRNFLDDADYSASLVQGRKLAQEMLSFYRKYVPGFEEAELAATGSLLGVRETRRIVGQYVLTANDFLARAVFPDEIGRYNYPIDIHRSKPPTEDAYKAFMKEFQQDYRLKEGESYGIPYWSLVPQRVDNLLVAGRCISTDRKMQGSIRVMPCCYLTGQAAGTAAAMCADRGTEPAGLDAGALRAELRKAGAYLP